MQNKQLERQLRSIIQSLKAKQIASLIDFLEQQEGFFLNKNFSKSGINCTCCTLSHEHVSVTGFGRNQPEALINAAKNYLQTLITKNIYIPQLKNALKLRQQQQKCHKKIPQQPIDNPTRRAVQQTIDLQGLTELAQISQINTQQQVGCSCIYYQVHQHHMDQIKNLQARMKLIIKQNQMLKQLVLKDLHQPSKNKENLHQTVNYHV